MEFRSPIDKYSALLNALLESRAIAFSGLKPSSLPVSPGVYRIFEPQALALSTIYVGQSENLRSRLYHDHLMGNTRSSTLKKKLVRSGRYPNAAAVKGYLRHDCSVQFIVIHDAIERNRLEHFVVALLGPYFND